MSRANNLNTQTKNEYHSVSANPQLVNIGRAFGNLTSVALATRSSNYMVDLGDNEQATITLPIATGEGVVLNGYMTAFDVGGNQATLNFASQDGSTSIFLAHTAGSAGVPGAGAISVMSAHATLGIRQTAATACSCSWSAYSATSMGSNNYRDWVVVVRNLTNGAIV